MEVRFRKEGQFFLSYFNSKRKLLKVNEAGKAILDWYFNHDQNISEITGRLCISRGSDREEIFQDIASFLDKVLQEDNWFTFPVLEQDFLETPLTVEMELNQSCNLRCKHCFQDNHLNKIVPTEKVIENIDILYEKGIFELGLTGGELLLHPGIEEILTYCRKLNFNTNIVTNGTLLTDRIVKLLADTTCFNLKVSLEGIKEINDKIRGKGVFDKVNSSLEKVCEAGIPTSISCTLNTHNLTYIIEIMDYCEAKDLPLNLNLFMPYKKEQQDLVVPAREYFDWFCTTLETNGQKNNRFGFPSVAIPAKIYGEPPRKECIAGLSSASIDVEDYFIPCSLLKKTGYRPTKQWPLFNINFKKEWKSHPEFVRFRENNRFNCQARSFIFSGNVNGIDPYSITEFMKYHRN